MGALRTRQARWLCVLAASVAALSLSGCSGGDKGNNASPGPGGSGASSTSASASATPSPTKTTPPPPQAQVRSSPANGARGVSPIDPITISVTHGRLRSVTLTNSVGTHVSGHFAPDRARWKATEPLGYGKSYRWSGTAVGTDGRTVPVRGKFTTLKPATIMRAYVNIGDHDQVGIAAPVIIRFEGHVHDRAAAERRLSVRASVPTRGSWAWLPDDAEGSRVHWRPQHYWKPGTRVTVSAKLYGVAYGNGIYGKADFTSTFGIGRSQIVKADVNSHRLIVLRDGKPVFNFPASYGLGTDPNRNTRNGIHIVMEKFADKYMSNPRYGYENVHEKWAVRISNNGEFIHANPETVGVQGADNVTHGCVNLSTESAKAYFDSVLYGDPVEVTNSPIELSAADSDVYDWAVPWQEWEGMSALN